MVFLFLVLVYLLIYCDKIWHACMRVFVNVDKKAQIRLTRLEDRQENISQLKRERNNAQIESQEVARALKIAENRLRFC